VLATISGMTGASPPLCLVISIFSGTDFYSEPATRSTTDDIAFNGAVQAMTSTCPSANL
jgi:hypothetical protein